MRGLVNNGQNSCYANAAFQCLLNIKRVENSILNARDSILKKLVIEYFDPNIQGHLDLSPLRGRYFRNLTIQQDTSEFLHFMLSDISYPYLSNLCGFDQTIINKCSACSNENIQCERDIMCSLSIPTQQPKEFCTMTQLLNRKLENEWTALDGTKCGKCHSAQLVTKTEIRNFNHIAIFILQLRNEHGRKITDFRLRDVRKDIQIDNKMYAFSGAIFHQGESLRSGHYFAILQNGKNLFKVNDEEHAQCRWPNNSNDLYVLFYIEKS